MLEVSVDATRPFAESSRAPCRTRIVVSPSIGPEEYIECPWRSAPSNDHVYIQSDTWTKVHLYRRATSKNKSNRQPSSQTPYAEVPVHRAADIIHGMSGEAHVEKPSRKGHVSANHPDTEWTAVSELRLMPFPSSRSGRVTRHERTLQNVE